MTKINVYVTGKNKEFESFVVDGTISSLESLQEFKDNMEVLYLKYGKDLKWTAFKE